MKKRFLIGLLIFALTSLAIASRFVSIFFFDFFVMVISFTATYEMIKLYLKKEDQLGIQTNKSYIYLSLAYCYLSYMAYMFAHSLFEAIIYQAVMILAIFLISFVVDLFYLHKLYKNNIEVKQEACLFSTFTTLKLMIYPTTLISTLYGFGIDGLVLDKVASTLLVVTIFAVAMLTDVFAYIFGCWLRKGKFAPQISPKKSISGLVGGLFGGIVASLIVFLISYYLLSNPFENFEIGKVIAFFAVEGILGSVVCQFGDLIASSFKRTVDIKDYGKIFPGHGGMMDRVDGLMLTSTLTFLMMILFFHI